MSEFLEWVRRNRNNLFNTRTGKRTFTFDTYKNGIMFLDEDGTKVIIKCTLKNIEKALKQMPVKGPSKFTKDIMGPSYLWTIMMCYFEDVG